MRTNNQTTNKELGASGAAATAADIPNSVTEVDRRGPFPVPESFSRTLQQLDRSRAWLNGVQSPIVPTPSDFIRDEQYARKYYEGKDPQHFVRDEGGRHAIPVFDRKDLHRCLELLEAKKHLSPEQEEGLKGVIYGRAYGEFTWEGWKKLGERSGDPQSDELSQIVKRVSKERIDWAIAKATSLNERAGIRVMLARKSSESGFIDPEVVPSGPVLFIKGNPVLDPEVETPHFRGEVEDLMKVPEGAQTSRATFFLSDIHIKHGKAEERNFSAALESLAKTPPRRLVIGGDIIDARGFLAVCDRISHAIVQPEERHESMERDELDLLLSVAVSRRHSKIEGHLTPGEALSLRRQMIIDRMQAIRTQLPDTEISLLLGNHDMPRLETALPMRPEINQQGTYKICGVLLEARELPAVSLRNGQLSPDWLPSFRRDLRLALESKGGGEQRLMMFDMLTDAQMVKVARTFYPIKGEKIESLHEFFYYDESWANELQLDLKCIGINTLNKRSDKYYEVDLGSPDKPQKGLLSHQPLESGDNLNRVIREKPMISGGQTKWPEGTRFVVAFDQHAACSVIMDRDGSSVSVHQVGSLTPNSNPGQKFMCAVMDPDTGSLFHLTFADDDGELSELRLADYRQLQYILPTVDPKAPPALASTTGNFAQQPLTPA